MKISSHKLVIILFFILMRCNDNVSNIVKNDIINAKINQVIELKSIYFQNNIDNISHLDSTFFSWTSDKLLQNNLILNPAGTFGEKAYVTPTAEGTFEVDLIIKHRWTGKVLNMENFIFYVDSSDHSDYHSFDEEISDSKIDTEMNVDFPNHDYGKPNLETYDKNDFYVQFGAFKDKQKALKELSKLEKFISNIFIINLDSFFKIQSGPYKTFTNAKNISESLFQKIKKESWIVQNTIINKNSNVKTNTINKESDIKDLEL